MSDPIIKLDTNGQAAVISYNVPEPTSYSGRNIIELDFDEGVFTELAKTAPKRDEVTADGTKSALEAAAKTGVVNEALLPNAARKSRAPKFQPMRPASSGPSNPPTPRRR